MLYTVGLTRTVYETTTITIDAENEDLACDLAIEMEKNIKKWTVEDSEVDIDFVEPSEDD